MPRYIDADDAIYELKRAFPNDDFGKIIRCISRTPTADVVEVRRYKKERVVDTLKPCPFCGGDNVEIRTDDNGISWYIFCNDCGLIAGYSMTKVDLAKIWNRRAKDE